MGADNCVVFYGLRYFIAVAPVDDLSILEPHETETDARMVRASAAGLGHWFGVEYAGGGEYFLLVGRLLGNLGAEGEVHIEVTDDEFGALCLDVRKRLADAGLEGAPALHFQFMIDM